MANANESKSRITERRKREPRFTVGDGLNALHVSPEPIFVCRGERITFCNIAGEQLLEAETPDQLIGMNFLDLLDKDYAEAIGGSFDLLVQEKAPFAAKVVSLRGRTIGVEISTIPARELAADATVILARDITRFVRLSEQIRRSEATNRTLIENALDLMCVCEAGKIVFINATGVHLLKARSMNSVIGRQFADILHPDYQEIFADGIEHMIGEGALPVRVVCFDGEIRDFEIAVMPAGDHTVSRYTIEARDITGHIRAVGALRNVIDNLEERIEERTKKLQAEVAERKRAEEKLRHLASHDGLTNLPNRSLLKDRLGTALARVDRYDHYLALLFVDLDGFKRVNDVHGHDAGDLLLKEVANRLASSVRAMDTVARIGGDEFVVALDEIKDRAMVAFIAKKIIGNLSKPIAVKDCEAQIGASIGIALAPENGVTADDLLKCADQAMYRVKQEGRNNFKFVSELKNENAA